MTNDIIERAESLIREGGWGRARDHIVIDLIAALKAARAEVDQLKTWLSEKETY